MFYHWRNHNLIAEEATNLVFCLAPEKIFLPGEVVAGAQPKRVRQLFTNAYRDKYPISAMITLLSRWIGWWSGMRESSLMFLAWESVSDGRFDEFSHGACAPHCAHRHGRILAVRCSRTHRAVQGLQVQILLKKKSQSKWILAPAQNGKNMTHGFPLRLFVSINNNPVLVQIMAWPRIGDKPLSEPMLTRFMTHICGTMGQGDDLKHW